VVILHHVLTTVLMFYIHFGHAYSPVFYLFKNDVISCIIALIFKILSNHLFQI